MARILYAEDEETVARAVDRILRSEGHEVEIVGTGAEFRRRIAEAPPDLCLLDLHLPDATGLALLSEIHGPPVIIMTASQSIEDAVVAMKQGAVEYLMKPVDSTRLRVSVRNALRLAHQEREIERLRSDVAEAHSAEHLVGSSEAMAALREQIARAAASDATVLISGESGTGKELVARALHFSGPRKGGPFVDVNSAALSETLIDSELFGHEKGAFTGADARRAGKFEQADGGTLFLDEIGDMPAATQAKILRALEEKAFPRLGGSDRVAVNVRVVCATNRDLPAMVAAGSFRKDLFYRINTLVLEVPPLRSRASDVEELARHFLARARRREKRAIRGISPAALAVLGRHSWPGNVRELQHVVDRAVVFCDGDEIATPHLPPALRAPGAEPQGEPAGLGEAVERLERRMILEALEEEGWVKARAARRLGLTERILSYKMSLLGIRKRS